MKCMKERETPAFELPEKSHSFAKEWSPLIQQVLQHYSTLSTQWYVFHQSCFLEGNSAPIARFVYSHNDYI